MVPKDWLGEDDPYWDMVRDAYGDAIAEGIGKGIISVGEGWCLAMLLGWPAFIGALLTYLFIDRAWYWLVIWIFSLCSGILGVLGLYYARKLKAKVVEKHDMTAPEVGTSTPKSESRSTPNKPDS